MIEYKLLTAIFVGISVLLILILRFKVQAFLSLLIASIVVGIIAGMNPNDIITTMKNGMASKTPLSIPLKILRYMSATSFSWPFR